MAVLKDCMEAAFSSEEAILDGIASPEGLFDRTSIKTGRFICIRLRKWARVYEGVTGKAYKFCKRTKKIMVNFSV